MSFPKQLNLENNTVLAAGALPGANNNFFVSVAGAYTLPALSGLQDGTLLIVKNTSASATCTVTATGTDTIDGGATASLSLTSGAAGAGLCAWLVGSKNGGAPFTWWRVV